MARLLLDFSQNIKKASCSDPIWQILMHGDFIVHNRGWLLCAFVIQVCSGEAKRFALINNLSQLADLPTNIPERGRDGAQMFGLPFTSTPVFLLTFFHFYLVHHTTVLSRYSPSFPILLISEI